MSLGQRLQSNENRRGEGISFSEIERYENTIRQLKLLSKSQTTLFKAYVHEKLADANALVTNAISCLNNVPGFDPKVKELRNALSKLNIGELEVDVNSAKIPLQEELARLRVAAEGGGLPAAPVAAVMPPPAPPVVQSAPVTVMTIDPQQAETIKMLEAENQKLKTSLEDSKREISNLASKPTGFADVDRLNREVADLKAQITESQLQIQKQENALTLARNEVEATKRSLELEMEAKEHALQEIQQMFSEVTDLDGKRQQDKRDFDAKLLARNKELIEANAAKMKEQTIQYEQEKKEMEDAMTQEIEEMERIKEEEKAAIQGIVAERDRTIAQLKKSTREMSGNLNRFKQLIHDLRGQLTAIQSSNQRDMNDFKRSIRGEYGPLITDRLRAMNVDFTTMKTKYVREVTERKRLHNIIQELKGNIRVYMRCRPPTAKELENFGNDALCVSFPNQGEIKVINEKNREKTWEFDEVFDFNTTQEQVYSDVSQLVTSVLDGYNVCIFAYGQTGSGKTWTMMGPAENRGVNTRALEDLFIKTRERAGDWTDSIKVSILEVYNEEIRDLLGDSRSEEKLSVKMGEFGNYVQGLTQVPVEDNDAVLRLIQTADRNRSSAITNMNEHSSRSHMILTVSVLSEFRATNTVYRGKLNLVDLAGSERLDKSGAVGQALKEAQNINKSLFALGDVIAAKSQKNSHIPFRNSTLTYLLQDSLSQDSKTLMIVCISPVLYNAEETFCSLNFASKVRTVELGKASKKEVTGSSAATGSSGKSGASSDRPAPLNRRASTGVR